MTDPRVSRARRRLALRVGGSAVVLTMLFLFLPAGELVRAVRTLSWTVWPIAIAMFLCFHLVGVTKWRLLANAAGAGLGFRDAWRAYYWGLFGNTFLPSIVGGDLVRAGVAFGHVRSRSGLILGSIVDRALDVVALGTVAGIGVLFSPRALDARSRGVFLSLAAVLAMAAVAGGLVLRFFPVRRVPFRYRRRLVQVRRAIRATASRPHAIAFALMLGMGLQSLLVALAWQLGTMLGITVPFYVWLFVWPLAKVAAMLPFTQGGIGVREAAQAALFAPFGVAAVTSVAAGLVFEVVIVGGGLTAGAISLLLRRRGTTLAGNLPTGRGTVPASLSVTPPVATRPNEEARPSGVPRSAGGPG